MDCSSATSQNPGIEQATFTTTKECAVTDLWSIKRITEGRDPGKDLLNALTKRLNSCVAHLVEESPLHSCKGGGSGGQASNAVGKNWVGGDAYQTLHCNSTTEHNLPQEQLKMKVCKPKQAANRWKTGGKGTAPNA